MSQYARAVWHPGGHACLGRPGAGHDEPDAHGPRGPDISAVYEHARQRRSRDVGRSRRRKRQIRVGWNHHVEWRCLHPGRSGSRASSQLAGSGQRARSSGVHRSREGRSAASGTGPVPRSQRRLSSWSSLQAVEEHRGTGTNLNLTPMLLVANLANAKWYKNPEKNTETLANGYSSESTQQELSNEYQHDRV